jgi:hypothetical protein
MADRRETPASGKPRRNASAEPTPTVPAEQDVARRAYQLFVERGGEHGRDWEDWLAAERELRAGPRRPAAALSASSLTNVNTQSKQARKPASA